MKTSYTFYLMSLFLLLLPYVSHGQTKYKGKVIDSVTKKGIENATWRMTESDLSGTTSKSGKFSFKSDQIREITFTHKDYHTSTIHKIDNGAQIELKKIPPQEYVEYPIRYEKGQERDGYKVGIWEYYDTPDTLALKIDYDKGTLLYVLPDTSMHAIYKDGEWVETKLDQAPRYIGSYSTFLIDLAQNLKIFYKVHKYKRDKTFYISFNINLLGIATNYQIHSADKDLYGEVVLEAISDLPNLWIVAQKDGMKYPSRLIFPVVIEINKPDDHNEELIPPSDLPSGQILRPIRFKLKTSRSSRTIINPESRY